MRGDIDDGIPARALRSFEQGSNLLHCQNRLFFCSLRRQGRVSGGVRFDVPHLLRIAERGMQSGLVHLDRTRAERSLASVATCARPVETVEKVLERLARQLL